MQTSVFDEWADSEWQTPPHLAEYRDTRILMDTLVDIHVVAGAAEREAFDAIARAFEWFSRVEQICSRFEPSSEVMRLSERVGEPVVVSPILFETVRFALEVARESGGAFDPTVGHLLESQGFNRNYRTGETIVTHLSRQAPESGKSGGGRRGRSWPPRYTDVVLNERTRAITLRRPLILDLGAVAKGFAIDLAARELAGFSGSMIDAGGDIFSRGVGPSGEPWHIGIRHPRRPGEVLDVVHVSGAAVCTSGDYERVRPDGGVGYHIVDPRTGESPNRIAGLTVIAPTAMLADALTTAAFVLGTERGLPFIQRQGVEALFVSPEIETTETPGFARYRK
jgi:thiamine biosynthesis lipoprotein